MISERLFRVIVGLDQALNPIFYGGSEDVTLSAQTAYNELILQKNRKTRIVIDWVFGTLFGGKQHCYRSLRGEVDEFPEHREIILTKLSEVGVT